MDDPSLARRFEEATRIAIAAGDLARAYFDRSAELTVELKGPQDLVSAADREVEKLIRTGFARAFPGDGMLGEEGGAEGADLDGPLWVVDPIDGTTNFVHGIPCFAISI